MTRKVHLADKVNQRGDASALCFKKPRAIDMSKEAWSTDSAAVTCSKCIDKLVELSK